MSKMSAQKRLLEKSRQEKQAAKRERRHTRPDENAPGEDSVPEQPGQQFDQAELLAQLAELHRRFADGQVSLDEFEQTRDTLVQRLRVD